MSEASAKGKYTGQWYTLKPEICWAEIVGPAGYREVLIQSNRYDMGYDNYEDREVAVDDTGNSGDPVVIVTDSRSRQQIWDLDQFCEHFVLADGDKILSPKVIRSLCEKKAEKLGYGDWMRVEHIKPLVVKRMPRREEFYARVIDAYEEAILELPDGRLVRPNKNQIAIGEGRLRVLAVQANPHLNFDSWFVEVKEVFDELYELSQKTSSGLNRMDLGA